MLAHNKSKKIKGQPCSSQKIKPADWPAHLFSAEKLIENYKAHTISQLGFKIVYFGCPSAENIS